MAKIFLAVLGAWDPSLPGAVTLNYSSGTRYIDGVPSPASFDTRLIQPVTIRRTLFAPGTTQGGTQIALGELGLNNADGGLDGILQYGFDGRDLTVYLGEDGGTFPTDFEEVFVGTMQQAFGTLKRVTIGVRDRQFDTRKPVQTTLYAGTNVLPAGVEGTAADLLGKPKPNTFGKVFNAPGVLVNSDRHLYQWHTAALQSLVVYDKGQTLTLGTAHASLAALEGASVAAGTYHTWLAGGMARISGAPDGLVTGDATEGATAADRTAAQVARRVLLQAGWDAGDIDDDALDALDLANASEVGVFIREQRTVANVLDEVLGSVRAWWGQSPSGLFTAEVFAAPSGTPAASFAEGDNLITIEPQPLAAEEGGGIPFWRVVVRYARNWTPQRGDSLDSAVTQARRGWLENEYRTVSASDSGVLTAHPLAPTLEITTLLTDEADAQDLADAELALRGVIRRRFGARVELNDDSPQEVPLGGVVEITHDRFGLDAGESFRVTSIEPDARRRTLDLILWG